LQHLFLYTDWLDDESFWLHMSACDIFLALLDDTPLSRYCFPSKVVNYMAIGRPIIATDIGDIGAFVRDYACGITYPVGGANLAQAIQALASDPEGARRMGERGKEAVSRDLSWEVLGEKIEKVYYQVLDTKKQFA